MNSERFLQARVSLLDAFRLGGEGGWSTLDDRYQDNKLVRTDICDA